MKKTKRKTPQHWTGEGRFPELKRLALLIDYSTKAV